MAPYNRWKEETNIRVALFKKLQRTKLVRNFWEVHTPPDKSKKYIESLFV
jgi:hypothetical protein